MSKITNERLNPIWHRMLAVSVWQQWASKGHESAAEHVTRVDTVPREVGPWSGTEEGLERRET